MSVLQAAPEAAAPAAPARPPFWRTRGAEVLLVATLLIVSGLLHAWNMLGYPYFENDEATYLSRGWAFITEGQLDVATYRYDHAPLGWMAIGSWLGLTGGGAMFGGMLEAGRVLMLLVHLVSTVLVYLVAKRLAGGRMTAGVLAVLVFAMSPVGIYFQRRVLLDNLMVLGVLLALLLLLRRPLTLGATVASGLAFGVAVLVKLNAIFFGVGFAVLLWVGAVGAQRKHAVLQWFASAGGTVLLFFVYALLNEELFPAPVDADGEPAHVSLVDTFELQLGRGDFAWPWQPESSFMEAVGSWVGKDSLTLTLGAAAAVGLLLVLAARRFRDPSAWAVLALVGGYVAFLARGGIVIDLYIAPLIPFLAIAVGLFAARITDRVPDDWRRPAVGTVLAAALVAGYVLTSDRLYLTKDETANQDAALAWIEQEVPTDALIAADNYVYPELMQEESYTGAMYFFHAEYDPELRDTYADDWREIDYLVLTHEVVEQISQGTVPRMAELLEHSTLAASFMEGSSSFVDLDAGISTNGDWVQVWQTKSRNQIVLQDAWQRFRDDWIVSYGQVLEDDAVSTTSLDQVLAMEQALAEGDEAAFRGVWQWTTDHMRHREDDALTSWQWLTDEDGEGELGSSDTVCSADQRFIGLLLEADSTWGAPDLRSEAARMADDWWERCTFTLDGLRLVDSSADGSVDDQLINPSYFDPTLYRTFATQLPGHDWDRLIDDGYAFLARVLDERGTIPNWIVLTQEGDLAAVGDLVDGEGDVMGEDTLRLVPTLLREEIAGEPRARKLLDGLVPQVVGYAADAPGLPSSVALALVAQVRDIGADAHEIYLARIASQVDPETGTWDGTLADFAWTYSWHRFQERVPSALAVPIS
ncbi:glycosyl hydrolase family 8 [Demequina lignilytica]|uniref:Glycosyl hydrolase family 8 n=1 Tax=Demequina lignilytica TaxID=3051663 RepID=A0AB35MDU8_9MICO|nr:glycosyl hydrolase family 8 [Demequina sp. SYSU T0a273]MDN4481934.1 glycosyl hydrolase family 8 [Demequina sp. SYSU T0a273]